MKARKWFEVVRLLPALPQPLEAEQLGIIKVKNAQEAANHFLKQKGVLMVRVFPVRVFKRRARK